MSDVNEEVYEQGESFEDETDYYESGETEDTEDSEDDGSGRAPVKNKQFLIIAILIVVFLGVCFVVFMMMSGGVNKSFFGAKEPEVEAPQYPATTMVIYRGQTIEVPVNQETGEPIVPAFQYTEAELTQLRQVGFTGDEIEEFQSQEMEPQPLIDEAVQAKEQWAQTFIAPYFDTASDEFKEVLNTTWLALPEVEWYDSNLGTMSNYTYTLNADYEKVTAHGHQLFVKIYLNDNGDYAFMLCSPRQYALFKDNGNINVSITYTQTADGQKFITKIEEISVN